MRAALAIPRSKEGLQPNGSSKKEVAAGGRDRDNAVEGLPEPGHRRDVNGRLMFDPRAIGTSHSTRISPRGANVHHRRGRRCSSDQVAQECRPAGLVLLGALADAENLPKPSELTALATSTRAHQGGVKTPLTIEQAIGGAATLEVRLL